MTAHGIRYGLSVLSVAAPLVVLWLFSQAWGSHLPVGLPVHWGEGGLSDATVGRDDFATTCLMFAGVGTLIGGGGYVIPGPGVTASRWVIAIGGSIAGVSFGVWISAALSALDKPDGLGLALGPGALITMVAIVYGALPALLRPPRPRRK